MADNEIRVHMRKLPFVYGVEVIAGDVDTEPLYLEYNVDGTPLILTGVTWEMNITTARGAAGAPLLSVGAILVLTGGSGILVEDPVNGLAHRWVAAADTLGAVGVGTRWWELLLIFPDAHPQLPSVRKRWMHGPYVVFDPA